MPDGFATDVRELIDGMLTVNPAKRITISELKEHPAFRMNLPRDYKLPCPLPLPILIDPIDLAAVPRDVILILLNIGYLSEEEIGAELGCPKSTKAKIFYQMLCEKRLGTRLFEMLPWDAPSSHSPRHTPEIYSIVPQSLPGDAYCTGQPDRFGRRPLINAHSLEAFSIPQREVMGPDTQLDLVTGGLGETTFSLPKTIEAVQCFLDRFGFTFFYYTDRQLIAKSTTDDCHLIVTIEVQYLPHERLSLVARLCEGDGNEFSRFVSQLAGVIRVLSE
jgi:BR serine/threonine kinase